MRVCVTGGAGFVGSHLVQRLLAAGHEVLVLDDLSRPDSRPPAGASFERMDVCELDGMKTSMTRFGPDAVAHLAARTAATASGAAAVRSAQINVVGTAAALEAARACGARRFVYVSSAAVYGDPDARALPLDEELPPVPIAPYGASKVAGEAYVWAYARLAGLAAVVLRPSNAYGPGQRADLEGGVVARFCDALATGGVPTIYGDGGQVRDYVYVGDVAEAMALALEADAAPGHAFNVSTGRGVSVNELFRRLAALAGFQGDPEHAPARHGDIRDSRLSPARAERILGWRAQTDLVDGLRRTLRP